MSSEATDGAPARKAAELQLPATMMVPEPEVDDDEDADFKMIESMLSILFLRKFDQFEQSAPVLKRSLSTVAGRKAVVGVLSARGGQWAVCTNKQVFDCLRDVAAAVLTAVDAFLLGGGYFDVFCKTEADTMVAFVNVGQIYCFESESGGDRVYLQSRLRDFKVWSEMRLWNGMLAHVLPSDDNTDVVVRRNRRQTVSVFRQVLSQELLQPETIKGAIVARHLSAFAYVMLGQLGMPLQPVLVFVESSCLERDVSKDTKTNVLSHVAELARELADKDIDDELRLYDEKNRKGKAKDSVGKVGKGVKDVGQSAKQGPKSFTKSVIGNSVGLTKGVTKSVAKGTGKSLVYSAKKGGKVGLSGGRRLAGGDNSPRPRANKVNEGEVMSGYLWKQMGHGVVQELDLPGAINVGKSRRWKKFWFVLKPSVRHPGLKLNIPP